MGKKFLTTVFIVVIVSFLWAVPTFSQSKPIVELKTVVIDAGHGGKDPGAINGKTLEKNITLSVALKLGKLIEDNYPDVKVIYTRKTDKFVELHDRAAIANKNNADLFISIHVNAATNRSAQGHETFVMGTAKSQSNLEVCQLENSVIVLENDYTSKYEGFDPSNPESYIIFSLLQNSHLEQSLDFATLVQQKAGTSPIKRDRGVKQGNLLVLWKCTMPAVLIELGFISNSGDLKSLKGTANQQAMAKYIFNAFKEYKKGYDTDIYIPEEKQVASSSEATATTESFGIQIMAVSKILKEKSKELKGYTPQYFKSGKYYKYYIGEYSSREEAQKALPKIKKSFPQAFIIKLEQK
ncbi:MAG: N-acetylmuramoyl-L-alanine amidase [Bacteroidales bacterium]|nr:N-acetylmuramoyl-L-alanine amidase [Bacteroidales bacterium]